MYLRALKDRQGLRRSSVSGRDGLGRPLVDVIELDQHRYSRVEPEQSLLQSRSHRAKAQRKISIVVASCCIRTTDASGCLALFILKPLCDQNSLLLSMEVIGFEGSRAAKYTSEGPSEKAWSGND